MIGKAFVLHKRTTKNFRLRGWLDASPNHFYITKTSPSMDRASQGEMTPLSPQDFVLCEICVQEEIDKTYDFLQWREKMKTRPLRIFDPFAGSGAFVLGVCESGPMKFTHAIDIAPSAAETIRYAGNLSCRVPCLSVFHELGRTALGRWCTTNARIRCWNTQCPG